MDRAIDKQTILGVIIEAKRTDPETGSFGEWLAEYLAEHLPALIPPDHSPDPTKMVQDSTDKALTQSDLNSMHYDKVWLDYGEDGEWALVVNGRIYSLSDLEGCGCEDSLPDELMGATLDWPTGHYTVYRRPPEGGSS